MAIAILLRPRGKLAKIAPKWLPHHSEAVSKKTSSPKPLSQHELADHVAIFFRETSHDLKESGLNHLKFFKYITNPT
jgi:hypothetical protein